MWFYTKKGDPKQEHIDAPRVRWSDTHTTPITPIEAETTHTPPTAVSPVDAQPMQMAHHGGFGRARDILEDIVVPVERVFEHVLPHAGRIKPIERVVEHAAEDFLDAMDKQGWWEGHL